MTSAMNAADTLWVHMPHARAAAGLWVMLACPLLGAVLCGLLGRPLERWVGQRRGPGVVAAVAVLAMLGATAAAIAATLRLQDLPVDDRLLLDHLFTLFSVDRLRVDVALAFDPLAAVFALVITLVGTLIHVYAVAYMHGDAGRWRFFACLNGFVFAMLLLVLADSLLVSFVGWEGVGLCSYLLIGFWHRAPQNGRAAHKAFLYNRVGDMGFVAGMLLLVAAFSGALPLGPAGDEVMRRLDPAAPVLVAPIPHADAPTAVPAHLAVPFGPTLRLRDLDAFARAQDADGRLVVAAAWGEARLWGVPLALIIGLAFFVAMAGKSAQLPLALWLPDAMAGPTPVSALIHAATMVTAGVYLAARLSFLFVLSPWLGTVVALVGLTTALVGALLALVQQDIKKVLAYSTISQLGFMFLAIGAGAPGAAVFHVVTHACFKACLFLAAGALIHAQAAKVTSAAHAGHPAVAAFGPHQHEQRRRHADPGDPQDLRNMRDLGAVLPATRLAYLVGAVGLAGLPVASGFFSKDEILWRALTAPALRVPGEALYAVALAVAGLTAFYSGRSYFLAFARGAPGDQPPKTSHEVPLLALPVAILAVAAVVVGPLLGWPAAWGGHPRLEAYLAPVFSAPHVVADGMHAAARLAQLAGALIAVAGWGLAWTFYRRAGHEGADGNEGVLIGRLRDRCQRVHRALWNGLWLDDIARALAVHPVEDAVHGADALDRRFVDGLVHGVARLARGLAAAGGWVDRHVVDGLVVGVGQALSWSGRRLQRVQTGRINHYTLGITLGAALLIVMAWVVR